MHQLKLEALSPSGLKEQPHARDSERELRESLSLQREEAECLKQIESLYEKYLDEFKKTQKLRNQRRELEMSKLRLVGGEGNPNSESKRTVCRLKQELMKKQSQLSDLKREVISNSSRIRQMVKDIGELKGQIIILQCEFERLKSKKQTQEQACLQKQNSIALLNSEIKQQSLRKVTLLKELQSLRGRTIEYPSLAALQHQIAKMQSHNRQMRQTAYELNCL